MTAAPTTATCQYRCVLLAREAAIDSVVYATSSAPENASGATTRSAAANSGAASQSTSHGASSPRPSDSQQPSSEVYVST